MGQMRDARERAFEHAVVQNIAPDAPGAAVEIDGPAIGIDLRIGMDLRFQAVEHAHLEIAFEKLVDQMRADEAGAARDENMTFGHGCLPWETRDQRARPPAEACGSPVRLRLAGMGIGRSAPRRTTAGCEPATVRTSS